MSTQDEALLRWAEERLLGVWDGCSSCSGAGYMPSSGQPCSCCYGEGRIPRYEYLEAERALSDEQRTGLGEMVDPDETKFALFKLGD